MKGLDNIQLYEELEVLKKGVTGPPESKMSVCKF